jgi:hypothetical protein
MESAFNISPESFTGKHELEHGRYTRDKLDEYIVRYETIYLMRLLGNDLYKLFIADIEDYEPQSEPFKAIFEPLVVNDCDRSFTSLGVIDMLKGFIYFEFVKDANSYHTTAGVVSSTGEVSERQNAKELIERYNESVSSFWAIQRFIGQSLSNGESFYAGFQFHNLDKQGWF